MVDIDERILNRLDNHDKSLGDHCIRITKLEQVHLYDAQRRTNTIVYLLAGVAITELLLLVATYLPLMPIS